MKTSLLLTILPAAALAITGCTSSRPIAGEVVGKVYTPAHYEYRPRSYFGLGYGHGHYRYHHYGVALATDAPYYVSATHALHLLTWNYDADDSRWQLRRRSIDVNPTLYEAARPGDWFSYEPNVPLFTATEHFSRSLKDHPIGAAKPIPPALAHSLLHVPRPTTRPALRKHPD